MRNKTSEWLMFMKMTVTDTSTTIQILAKILTN